MSQYECMICPTVKVYMSKYRYMICPTVKVCMSEYGYTYDMSNSEGV